MEINYIPLSEIRPYEKNPRKNDEAVKYVANSIKEFGFKVPVVLDSNKVIVCGHTRWKAAKQLGIDPVPCIIANDLSEEKIKAFRLADNKTAEMAEWDETLLTMELKELQDSFSFDMSQFGFMEQLDPDEPTGNDDDFDSEQEAENIEAAVSRLGDLWILGRHRLLCGDSTDPKQVDLLMENEMADLWLTDPPYNVNVKNSNGMTICNDNMDGRSFGMFLDKAFGASVHAMKEGCPFYVWFASCEHINFEQALNSNGLKVRQELIWNKNQFILGRQDYQWKHEPCLYGWKDGSRHYFVDSRRNSSVIPDGEELKIDKMSKDEMKRLLHDIFDNPTATTVINENKPTRDAEHPTMKPVRLFAYLIENSSRAGEIVLDTFGGSGTTMVACEKLGRRARLMELDPKYVDVICKRYRNLSGKEACLMDPEGKLFPFSQVEKSRKKQ